MIHRPAKSAIGLAALLLLTACAVGTDYVKPETKVNQSWNAADNSVIKVMPAAKLDGPWWSQFKDKTLSVLIQHALQNNNDLKTAEERIREARANERATWAGFWPQINAQANGTRGKLGASSLGIYDTSSSLGVSGDWDLDIFGGNRRRDEAANADIAATIADRDNVRLALIAEVAKNYMQLRTAQRQRELTLQNLGFQQDTLNVTNGQRAAGAISDLEVARANAQAKSTASRLPQIETAITAALNRLNILCGENPGALDKTLTETKPLPQVPQSVVAATPISAIERRPDVRAAERRLAEASALTNAAFAEFFPKISLSGFLGAQSSITYGSESPWSAAINGIMPLLNFGRVRAGVNAADARQQQAFYNYQQTILLALEETENALTGYLNEQKRRDMLATVAAEQDKAAVIAREQYKAGVATQLDLLTAEGNKLDAENDLALSDFAVAQNLITLYRALGENINGDEPAATYAGPVSMPAPSSVSQSAAPQTSSPALSNTATPAMPISYENGVMVIQ